MRRGFRPPLALFAAALLGLIALLATLQYQWLGRISDAERERMRASLNARASEFAQDFDRELTRAFLLFQIDPAPAGENAASRIAARYERWQETARFPRMIAAVYFLPPGPGEPALQHFNPSTRFLEPAEWPSGLGRVRAQLAAPAETSSRGGAVFVRTIATSVWEDVPALVVPAPVLLIDERTTKPDVRFMPFMSYTILVLDRDYVTGEVLPALGQQHFGVTAAPAGARTVATLKSYSTVDYRLAVLRESGGAVMYHSVADYSPAPDAAADVSVALFQVKPQDFVELASELRRFVTFRTSARNQIPNQAPNHAPSLAWLRETVTARETLPGHPGAPLSILVQPGDGAEGPKAASIAAGLAAATSRASTTASPRWRLVVQHPSGSLEHAVNAARRRNLMLSSGILAVLSVSLGLLVLATRRAQSLAQQQMEFVATVSHELRTPLAVIRSAADNLADGVIKDEADIRRYGTVVRAQGRRLSDLVEQILEYAGLQAGQRAPNRAPVEVDDLLREVVEDARPLASEAGLTIELATGDPLPLIFGDEAALGRAFQNLIGNGVKYGAGGRRIGVRATARDGAVQVAVEDEGIGISAADQAHIFDPFFRAPEVVAAQTPGAGLGLSLVKRIVEAHGGTVTVASAPGQGALFAVTLPAFARDARQGAGAVSAAAPHRS